MTDICTINIRGELISLDTPHVMGILNVTPDSFYAESRKQTEDNIRERVRQIRDEGATMVDIGGYSTRPGAEDVPPEEETKRLLRGIAITRQEWPDAIISVDTFRSAVAKECIENGADMINDISGGDMDTEMFQTVADLHVPYILVHSNGTPQSMLENTHYEDLMSDALRYLGEREERLHELGVADIIIDPGFGFAKTLEQNYELLNRMEELSILELPMLVGVSRKSMIYKPLGGTPETALNGTTVLNTIALMKGAKILRVHDVKEAVEVKVLMSALK